MNKIFNTEEKGKMNKTLLVLNLDFSESYHECSTHRFVGSYELTKYSSHNFICLLRILKNDDLYSNIASATQKISIELQTMVFVFRGGKKLRIELD